MGVCVKQTPHQSALREGLKGGAVCVGNVELAAGDERRHLPRRLQAGHLERILTHLEQVQAAGAGINQVLGGGGMRRHR